MEDHFLPLFTRCKGRSLPVLGWPEVLIKNRPELNFAPEPVPEPVPEPPVNKTIFFNKTIFYFYGKSINMSQIDNNKKYTLDTRHG